MKLKLQYYLIFVFLFSFCNSYAQVLTLDHGKVEFYTTSILSDIDAITEDVYVKLDMNSGEFEVIIDVESFEFEYDLMQEHFAEKYMETDKFPQAVFKGKIIADISNIKDATEVDVSGEMTIHGIEKELNVKVNISKKDDLTFIKCKIPIVFKDYNVEEPSILTKSVAKDVEVKTTLYLK